MDAKPVRFGCLSLIAIVGWTIVGLLVLLLMTSIISTVILIVDPGAGTDDNPLAFLMLLALPAAALVAFIGSVVTIRWLRRRYVASGND